MVSHELRTPLTAIKSSAEILQAYEDIDKETERDFISIINSECDRLTRLINDILDLSMIESGEHRWHISEVSIPEVIDTAVNAARALILEEELTLVCDIEPNMPSIQRDRDKLIQVMTNLIGNAIKFTPENGQIEVKAQCVGGDAASDARPEIHVTAYQIPESEYPPKPTATCSSDSNRYQSPSLIGPGAPDWGCPSATRSSSILGAPCRLRANLARAALSLSQCLPTLNSAGPPSHDNLGLPRNRAPQPNLPLC